MENIPQVAILVAVDVVGLHPTIPHEVGLNFLSVALDNRQQTSIDIEDLIMKADFVLKDNFFEFNEKVKQQI